MTIIMATHDVEFAARFQTVQGYYLMGYVLWEPREVKIIFILLL